MATSQVTRLAPANARDGVDTRKKDNSGKAAAGTEETTSMGATHVTVGQQAAVEYMLPPGAEVEGSVMQAHWNNYMRLADAYVAVSDDLMDDCVSFAPMKVHWNNYPVVNVYGAGSDLFRWVSFEKQQSYNDIRIQDECDVLGGMEGVLNTYRQFYNQSVTELRKEQTHHTAAFAKLMLDAYMDELKAYTIAATKVQRWIRA